MRSTWLNDSIWKLFVPMTVFGNYFFEWWYLHITCFEEIHLKSAFSNDGIWKRLGRRRYFETASLNTIYWWYLESTWSINSMWKLVVPLIVLGNYFYERQYLETTSSKQVITKLFPWTTVFGNCLFQRLYLKFTCSNGSIWNSCFSQGI